MSYFRIKAEYASAGELETAIPLKQKLRSFSIRKDFKTQRLKTNLNIHSGHDSQIYIPSNDYNDNLVIINSQSTNHQTFSNKRSISVKRSEMISRNTIRPTQDQTRNQSILNIQTLNTGSELTLLNLNENQRIIEHQQRQYEIDKPSKSAFKTLFKLEEYDSFQIEKQGRQNMKQTPILISKNRSRAQSFSKQNRTQGKTQDSSEYYGQQELTSATVDQIKTTSSKESKHRQGNNFKTERTAFKTHYQQIIQTQQINKPSKLNENLLMADIAIKLLGRVKQQRTLLQDFQVKNSDIKIQEQSSCQKNQWNVKSDQQQLKNIGHEDNLNLNLDQQEYMPKYIYDEQSQDIYPEDIQEENLEYNIVKRPQTPIKLTQSSQKQLPKYRRKSKDQLLLNQFVIDSDKFRQFLEYKSSRNDFRKPNETFYQQMGDLNPYSKRNSRPQTASTNQYLSFIQQKASNLKLFNNSPSKSKLSCSNLSYNLRQKSQNPLKPIEQAIFDIPLWDIKNKQLALEQLKSRREDLKFQTYLGQVEKVNEIKDYLWNHKNLLKREQIMKLAILIDRMSGNIKRVERDVDVLGNNQKNARRSRRNKTVMSMIQRS